LNLNQRRTDTHCRPEAGVVDPSRAPDDPTTVAHRLIDSLTATKLRVGSLQLRVREDSDAPAAIAETLTQIEHELDAAAELAQVLRATAARSAERDDDSGAWAGATNPGGR
jgi:hypothetical protein